jgi:hypothetical protein
MFHTTVPTLASVTLNFEMMGSSLNKPLDMMNDQIIGVLVTKKS